MQTTRPAGLDQVERQRGQVRRRSRRRRPRRRAGRAATRSVQACSKPERSGRRPATASSTPQQVHLGPGRAQEHRRQQADGAGSEDQRPVARPRRAAASGGAQRVAAGLHERAEERVDGVRAAGAATTPGRPAARRARPAEPPRTPTSRRCSQTCWWPRTAAPAGAVAEHGVAHDPAADPGRVDARAHGGDGPGPLVAQPQREGGVAGVQVGHLAGEELDVGAADARPARRRRRPRPVPATGSGHLLDAALAGGRSGRSARIRVLRARRRQVETVVTRRQELVLVELRSAAVVRRAGPQRLHPPGLDAARGRPTTRSTAGRRSPSPTPPRT